MMLMSLLTNTPISKTMHIKLKESPLVGPRTPAKPANGFSSTTGRWYGWV